MNGFVSETLRSVAKMGPEKPNGSQHTRMGSKAAETMPGLLVEEVWRGPCPTKPTSMGFAGSKLSPVQKVSGLLSSIVGGRFLRVPTAPPPPGKPPFGDALTSTSDLQTTSVVFWVFLEEAKQL